MKAEGELEPRLLRSFVAVAEELHFGRAARRLHISQPPLSMQIRKLEALIGARLFERDRRNVALTEAGAFLLQRARHLLDESTRACAEARRIGKGESGALAIGYTTTATYEVLPPLIRAFRKARPDVQLELIEMRSPLQPGALRASRIEIGLACGPLKLSDLEERIVVEESFVVAVGRRSRFAQRERLRVRDLEGEPFVLVRPDVEPAWAEACNAELRRAGIQPSIAQETDSKLAMLGLVAAGLGISLVSASMQRLGRAGVRFVPLADFRLRLPLVSLILPTASARARAFLELTLR
jgi:DNA-binding transcriptional LysR family regulator